MAGGQPFSIENLRGVRELTRAHGVPFILDATRISENALFVKRREPGYADRTLASIVREIAELSDGAVFSSKKDHFVPIGGLLALNDDAARRAGARARRRLRGLPALRRHRRRTTWRRSPRASTSRWTRRSSATTSASPPTSAGCSVDAGVPVVVPLGAHAVFLDAKRFLPHLPHEQFPAQSLAAAIYLEGGGADDGARDRLGPARRRAVRRARARAPDAAAARVHRRAPRLRRRGRRAASTAGARTSPACG